MVIHQRLHRARGIGRARRWHFGGASAASLVRPDRDPFFKMPLKGSKIRICQWCLWMFMDVYGCLWMFIYLFYFFFTIDYSDNHITCWICLMEVWGLLELAITTVGVKIWLNVVHVNVPMFLQPCWSHHSKLNTFMGTNLSPNQKWPWLWSPLKWGIPAQMDTHGWNWGNQICPVLLGFQVSIEVLDFLFGSKNGSPAAQTLSPLTWAGMGHLGMDQDPRPIGNLLVGRTTHFCIVGSSCLNHAGLGLSSYVFNFCLNHLEESSTSLFRVLMRDHWEMPRCQFQPSHPPFSCKNQDHCVLCHWFSGWWFGTFFIFSYVGNFIIPFDELHHFSEGLKPPTRCCYVTQLWNITIYSR